MKAKHVSGNKFFLMLIFLLFVASNVFAQTEKEIYFLIDKNDTLIQKQFDSTTGIFSSYLLIDEKRIKKLNKTPLVEGKVWVPESDDDFHRLGPKFRFDRQNDKLITEEEFLELDAIKERKTFLNIDTVPFDLSGNSYFFIEPIKGGDTYILREVFPVVE